MSRELRRSYLIRRSFQAKLVLRLSLMILVTSLMVALIFIGSRYYVVMIQQGGATEFRMLDELGGIFFEVLVWWLLGYLVLFAYFALRFSHEIAGPLYRFEKALTEIAEDGRIPNDIRLRDEDDPEFHHLAALFNRALKRVRGAIDGSRAALEEMATVEPQAESPAVRGAVARAREAIGDGLGELGRPAENDERQQHLPDQD